MEHRTDVDWRNELASVGVDESWKAAHGDKAYRGVVNVYMKMRALGLWALVVRAVEPDHAGNFHFLCASVEAFQHELSESGFTEPEYEGDFWHSRQPMGRLAMHIKHFPDWPREKLQAHIDPVGIVEETWWQKMWTGTRHLIGYRGYRDVEKIRTMMQDDGYAPNRAKRRPSDS